MTSGVPGGALVFFVLSTFVPAAEFDLSALPPYALPAEKISGSIRNYGNAYAGLLQRWETSFQKFHPAGHVYRHAADERRRVPRAHHRRDRSRARRLGARAHGDTRVF